MTDVHLENSMELEDLTQPQISQAELSHLGLSSSKRSGAEVGGQG
jgi:hypothetical protein